MVNMTESTVSIEIKINIAYQLKLLLSSVLNWLNDVLYMCAHTNKCLTMETEQVFIFLRGCGDLDDGNRKAVGGCGEDSRS